MKESWKPAIAALVILLGFGLVAHFMPNIMLWIGERELAGTRGAERRRRVY